MTSRTHPGVFIVFEGGDGSGKTTQAKILVDDLIRRGYDAMFTREPGDGELGESIRSILLNTKAQIDPRAEALLFAADRAQHVAAVVRPALARGVIVVCDRYIDSSIAYQCGGRGLDEHDVASISAWASEGLVPDVTVVLDVDDDVAEARRSQRSGGGDRIEADLIEHARSIRETFLRTSAAHPDRYRVVNDRGADVDTVAHDVHDAVLPFLPIKDF